ncbi:MAG: tyrosine-type recombinase/integrase [Dehalococcoidia bacterium]|nr:tyrosine-type recombinase/integrase [Dehalococcoidia bacterium]
MSKQRGNGEGSIYQRKDGRWVAAVSYERGRRKTALAPNKADARKRLAELISDAEQGLALAPDPTLADFLRKWLAESAPRTLRPRTLAGYRSIVERHLIPALGRVRLRKLQPGDIDAYLNRTIKGGLTTRTAQYHHAVLRRALGQAERWGYVARNVARLVTPPQVRQRDIAPLTPAQARIFLASISGDRLEALYAVSLSLGLRQGEALGVGWDDVSLEERTLTVRHTLQRYGGAYHRDDPKTERSRRTVSLPAPLADALRQHRARQNEERLRVGALWAGDKWGLVFCDELGEPLSGAQVTRKFQARLAALGLPRQRFHDLRHAAATFLLAQGVPLRVVMEILGHSTITTTANVYGHVLPELQRDAMDRQGALLFGS